MRSLLAPRRVFAAVGVLVMWAHGAQAYLGHRGESVYVAPTASVLAVPTSYVVSTSAVWPTSYVVPTVYATSYSALTPTYYVSPTSYVASPTSYVLSPTSYVVRSPRRRTYVTRGYYVPTVASTIVANPVVPTTYLSDDCGVCPTVASATPVRSVPSTSAPQSAAPSERSPSTVIDSVPMNEPGLSSEPEPTAELTPPPSSMTNPPPPAAPAPEEIDNLPMDSSPVPPINETPASPLSKDYTLPGETGRREVQRPSFTDADVRSATASQGILEGRVVSAGAGRPEGGVRVILSERRQRFTDRIATTDALGRYAITLPEGDWTVRVEMPSRKVFPVSQITVSGGLITTTEDGREVSLLTIKR